MDKLTPLNHLSDNDMFHITEDEDTMVITWQGRALMVLNAMLPWNLTKAVYRQVWKKKGGRLVKVQCEFTDQMKKSIDGQGLPPMFENQLQDADDSDNS